MEHINEMRHKRTMAPEAAGSKGEQGAQGSGIEKSSNDGASKPSAKFQPASDVLSYPNVGDLDLKGVDISHGSATPGAVDYPKGTPIKPKNALDSGY